MKRSNMDGCRSTREITGGQHVDASEAVLTAGLESGPQESGAVLSCPCNGDAGMIACPKDGKMSLSAFMEFPLGNCCVDTSFHYLDSLLT